VKTVVKSFDDMASGGARGGHDLRGILRVVGEGFLHQHVFAAVDGGRAPFEMCRRWQRHIDEIDVFTLDQLRITTQGHRNRMLGGEVPGA
jgi:hypothetical protein